MAELGIDIIFEPSTQQPYSSNSPVQAENPVPGGIAPQALPTTPVVHTSGTPTTTTGSPSTTTESPCVLPNNIDFTQHPPPSHPHHYEHENEHNQQPLPSSGYNHDTHYAQPHVNNVIITTINTTASRIPTILNYETNNVAPLKPYRTRACTKIYTRPLTSNQHEKMEVDEDVESKYTITMEEDLRPAQSPEIAEIPLPSESNPNLLVISPRKIPIPLGTPPIGLEEIPLPPSVSPVEKKKRKKKKLPPVTTSLRPISIQFPKKNFAISPITVRNSFDSVQPQLYDFDFTASYPPITAPVVIPVPVSVVPMVLPVPVIPPGVDLSKPPPTLNCTTPPPGVGADHHGSPHFHISSRLPSSTTENGKTGLHSIASMSSSSASFSRSSNNIVIVPGISQNLKLIQIPPEEDAGEAKGDLTPPPPGTSP